MRTPSHAAAAIAGMLLLAHLAPAQTGQPSQVVYPPGTAPQAAAAVQTTSAPAQPATPGSSGQPATPSGNLTAGELEELLGPIALYPDSLLANVLAASVYPDEVKEAANFARGNGDPKMIESRDWEQPVKAIAQIPDVVKMMGEYMDWTIALGQAYLTQAQDVMSAVQRLRKKAQANGALQTTEQQKVVVEQETIYIQSADPEVVYVPSYQPTTVYVDDDDDEWAAAAVGFGTAVVVGAIWADLACDWHHGCIGWGHTEIDIDRNFNGDINIGNDVGSGNRVNHNNRVGKEGGAWSPNRSKSLATSKADARSNFRGGQAGTTRAATPRDSSANRAANRSTAGAGPRSTAQNSRAPSSRQNTAARPSSSGGARPSASRTPTPPSRERASSAFSGGSDSRASSSRGSSSRQSASRNSGGSRPSASRSSGGGGRSMGGGGGGRRGGGGGGRRR